MKFWPFKKSPSNLTLQDGDEFSEKFGFNSVTNSGASVTQQTALSQSAVYACVRVLSETVASLPLKVYRRSGETREAVDHPLNRLLGVSPNDEQTSFELREFQMTCLGLRGNAYSQKLYTRGGLIGEINPLDASKIKVDRDNSGNLIFDYQETGSSRVFKKSDIWRVAGLGSNGVTGLSPIALARESIGTSIAVEGHGASSFKNNITPSVILHKEGVLSDPAFERLKEQLDSGHSGYGNSGKPFIAEDGLKPEVISMTNSDAQFIESRKFQAEDIARWYRVPPHMIGLLDRATFSNIEQQSIDFVQNTIRPWLVRLESSMMRDLLTRSEQDSLFLSHTVDALLRGDTKTRYEAYGSAIDKGWRTRNEIRLLENLKPEDGLNEFVLPVNVETISEREQRFESRIAETLADQENNAIRQELNKGEIGFDDRIVDFYARFTDKLISFGVCSNKAADYSVMRVEQIENKQFKKIERSAQLQIASIL